MQAAILDTGCDSSMVPPRAAEGFHLEPSKMIFFALGCEQVPLLEKVALGVKLRENQGGDGMLCVTAGGRGMPQH